jgi:hypothetical protein
MKTIFDIKIDCYENGQGIVITRRKDRKKWSRVFLMNENNEAKIWMDNICKENEK